MTTPHDSDDLTRAERRIRELEEKNRSLRLARCAAAVVPAAGTGPRPAHADDCEPLTSRFLANLGHELRTPISGIIGMAELLAAGGLTSSQRDRVDAILGTADSFLDLLNQLVDFARAEARAIELERVEFDLWRTCEGVAELLQVQTIAKGIDLAFHLAPDVPREVVGDRVRLRQILLNLGTNAVKFTARGVVSLHVATGERDGEPRVEFVVADTGCGFDPALADRLFEPFVQADASTARRFGGAGLGLSICRNLAEAMGGEVRCDSTPGRGSTFTVSVPVAATRPRPAVAADRIARVVAMRATTLRTLADHLPPLGYRVVYEDDPAAADLILAEAALDSRRSLLRLRRRFPGTPLLLIEPPGAVTTEARYEVFGVEAILHQPPRPTQLASLLTERRDPVRRPEATPTVDGTALRALVADDSPINRRVLVEQLGRFGFEVVEARDGEQTVEAFRGAPFDVVFLDRQMPGLDGCEAARELRRVEAEELRPRSLVVALTADTSAANEQHCLDSGMDRFCTKPIRARELEQLLAAWLAAPAAAR